MTARRSPPHRSSCSRPEHIENIVPSRPVHRGASGASKTVGQIPSSYKQGSGKILSGATANKATEAALAAYAGGVVDRVVQLSNDQYEVRTIGVNWPHHIFENADFHVIGAND